MLLVIYAACMKMTSVNSGVQNVSTGVHVVLYVIVVNSSSIPIL